MESKLKEAKVSSTTTTSTISTKKENKMPPKDAKIISKTERIETEEIENGWIITKYYDISFEVKGQRDYTYFNKKWYSKTNPLTVKIDNKALAEEFDD